MHFNYLAFAVPLFIGLMWLEYAYSCKKKKQLHQFNESIANINVGIAERFCDLLTTGSFYFLFCWIHDHFSLLSIHPGPWTWVALFLATDLLWYWYHRFGHEINLFWSLHVVHHQSEDFNFTVSARITVIQAIARGIFWSMLPLIGFPPGMITVFLLIHGTYPFFTHTQLIGKLGWVEYFFVTPSHHRVHHSRNPEYLDKNYGDILIIWDKVFGTFAEEKAQPVYGLTKPLKSYSFFWQHFHFQLEMWMAFRSAKTWKQKWKVVFGRPDDLSPVHRERLEEKLLFRKENNENGPLLQRYVTVQTLITLFVLFFTILLEHYLKGIQIAIIALFIFTSVVTTGAMLEQKKWVFYLEYLRLFSVYCFLYSFPQFKWASMMILMLLLGGFLFYNSLGKRYRRLIYQE